VSDTSALYEPLIERDLAAIPAAARAFADAHSPDDLWIAVTRFAVLAYVPSQHAKRAVMACRAAHDLREELGERWIDMIIECARYAAESRPPWSEPPILDPPLHRLNRSFLAHLSRNENEGSVQTMVVIQVERGDAIEMWHREITDNEIPAFLRQGGKERCFRVDSLEMNRMASASQLGANEFRVDLGVFDKQHAKLPVHCLQSPRARPLPLSAAHDEGARLMASQ
jgi:hypothetical protein